MDGLELHRVGSWCHRHRVPVIPGLTQVLGRVLFASVVPAGAQIGRGTMLGYGGLGVVIHERSRIGENVMVSPGVTIGGRSRQFEVPVIERDVFVGTGAKILGSVTVGEGSVIGANAVVISDVPPRSVVAGIPARVIATDVDVRRYADLPDDVRNRTRKT